MNPVSRLLIILLILVVGGACTGCESERTFLTTVPTSTPKSIIHEGQNELPPTVIIKTPQPSLTPILLTPSIPQASTLISNTKKGTDSINSSAQEVELSPTSVATILTTAQITQTVNTDDKNKAQILDRISNPDCRLPCFMGFYPMETTLDEIRNQRIILADEIRFSEYPQYSSFTAVFHDSLLVPHQFPYELRYLFKPGGDILWEIDLELPQGDLFTVKQLFRQYGTPADIWISAIDFSSIFYRDPIFRIFLYYPEHGFFVHYDIKARKNEIDTGVIGCMNQVRRGYMIIWAPNEWDPNRIKTISDRAEANNIGASGSLKFSGFDEWSNKYYEQPLINTTNFTIESLHDSIIDSDIPVCIETLFEHWPQYSGE